MSHIPTPIVVFLIKLLLTPLSERLVKFLVDWLVRYLTDKFGL